MTPFWIFVLVVLVILAIGQFGRTPTDDGRGKVITFTCTQCGLRESHRNQYLDVMHAAAVCRFCGGEQTHRGG